MAASSIIDITRNMGKGWSVAIMEMEGHEAAKEALPSPWTSGRPWEPIRRSSN
jgi:hypothetical protein